MKIGNNVNTETVKEKKTYEPIPKGRYSGTLKFVQEKSTKDGTGKYVDATFQITEGSYEGRYIFHKFHLENKNPKCQEIGIDQLDKFLKCIGVKNGYEGVEPNTKGLIPYRGKNVAFNLAIEEARNGFPARNRITSFAVK